VIRAHKLSLWKGRYQVLEGDQPVASWEPSPWSTGGTVILGGQRLRVRTDLLGDQATMVRPGGQPVARARGVTRRNWTIEADGVTYRFRRSAPWRHQERLHDGTRTLGRIRRTGIWRGDAEADLPGVPRTVELFAIALVLSRWESEVAPTG
jgi:hypothetical protein